MKTIFITPIGGNILIDPATKQLVPTEGLVVEKSIYWLKRAAEGGVSIREINEPEEPATPAVPEKQEPKTPAKDEDK